MYKRLLIISFSCILLFAGLNANAQGPLKIISVQKNVFLGTSILVKGESSPNSIVSLRVASENNLFSYSVKTNSDAQGNWFANLDQSLKTGKYYIEATENDSNGLQIGSAKYGPIEIKGSFVIITGIFSFLVIILLAGFVGGWYINKLAEVKRYRRILMSQRDIVSSYNILKKDADKAIKNLSGGEMNEGKISETEFLLKRISDNLEKMNKYVLKGMNTISNYDIIKKINNLLKI